MQYLGEVMGDVSSNRRFRAKSDNEPAFQYHNHADGKTGM